ncbi:MAG: prenyltransferase [Anaerolinea sp.]|nr:prenyltransferase [Anaerolinea sp.]
MITSPSLATQLRGLIQLTRWREYVFFGVPLTILGALLASSRSGLALDVRLLAVIAGNILALAYAFMINDIEDAPDDARDPHRAAKNPVTSGLVNVRFGYAACRVVAAVTLIMYALGGWWPFVIGGTTLLLSHLYSWRVIRLKAWPVTDIVSHSLMLSGLLLLAGYFTYDTSPGWVWLVAAGATLVSVYGQLYNQLRDYDMDKAAGLHNTAIMLGERNARRMMYSSVAVAALCMIVALIQGVFPIWLSLVLLIAVPVSMLFKPKTDARGTAAIDISGTMQIQSLVILNILIGVWLLEVLIRQVILS